MSYRVGTYSSKGSVACSVLLVLAFCPARGVQAANCAAFDLNAKSSKPLATVVTPQPGTCRVQIKNGYPVPDPKCTPGAINETVTETVLRNPEFRTSCVRDIATTPAEKANTYAWYQLTNPRNNRGVMQTCELDHLVSLELGGADTLDNIWPQCGPSHVVLRERFFKQKDAVENYLAKQVRDGLMKLKDAQDGIAQDWTQYLQAAFGGQPWTGAKELQGPSAPPPRTLARRSTNVEQEPHVQALSASACQSDLASCPLSGCASPGTPHAIANERKRTLPTGSGTTLLTFDDFASLQQQADSLVGEGQELSADQRAQLSGLTVSAGQVSEGDPVSITGYLVGTPHPNTGESVNCNLRGEPNNDFHIPVSNDPGNTDFQGIVVEMIPQNRDPNWTLANLTQIESNGQLVLVSGALFYDNLHRVNGDPGSPVRGQPHRFSLWEVHPITQFAVCAKADNTCDPGQPSDWTPLGGGQ